MARASVMPMFRAVPTPALAALASNFVGNQSVDAINCLTASTDPSSEWSSTTTSSTAVPRELMTDDMASVIEARLLCDVITTLTCGEAPFQASVTDVST